MAWYIEKNNSDELSHSGVKGQKWGVRRYQDEGGKLTAAGKARYMGMSKKGLTDSQKKSMTQLKYHRQLTNAQKTHIANTNKRTREHFGYDAYGEDGRMTKQFQDYYRDLLSRPENEKFAEPENAKALLDQVRKDAGDANADIMKRLIEESVERRKQKIESANNMGRGSMPSSALQAQKEAAKKHNSANNMGRGSIPTSAMKAKKEAEQRSSMQRNMPASAWNQRQRQRGNR